MAPNYQIEVLSKEDISRVHEASLKILAETGVVFLDDEAIEIFKKHGAKVDGNVVYFTRELVEDSLEKCPSKFELKARDAKKSVTVGEGLLIHPPGGEIFITNLDEGRRKGSLQDVTNFQKIFQAFDDIDIAGFQPISPQDVEIRFKGIYCMYEAIKHSDKPLLAPMEIEDTQQKRECLELLELSFGEKGYLQDNYCTWHAVCPNSPLTYTEFACDGIIEFARWNQPVLIVPAPMSGITAPINILGTVVLQNAEMLAGLVLAQLVNPGVPVIASGSSTFGNMQLATWECACPETALLVVACIQMLKHYQLPARGQVGITSSKVVDYQAGYEIMQSLLFTAIAGCQLMSQSVGSMENLITTSYEKLVIDTELISRVRRLLDGIDTSDKALSLDIIQELGHKSDYLLHVSTAQGCRDTWRPTFSDWSTYDAWEKGGEDIMVKANRKMKEVLANAPESLIDEQLDKELKDYIKLVEKNA